MSTQYLLESSSMAALLGVKLGMTQVFTEEGNCVPVTVVEAGPCTILQKRTLEKEGYAALRVAYGSVGRAQTKPETRERRLGKALVGAYRKANVAPQRWTREFRVPPDELAKYNIGDALKVDVFAKGAMVDVTGTTKGRGFAGVFKRHHMAGHVDSHGTHEFFRHAGAVGQRKTPGKVWKNKRMPGHFGNERVTVQNLEVVEVSPDRNLLLIRGAVPGATGGLLVVRSASKRSGPK
jgi:large subunit ribosomal protein L3